MAFNELDLRRIERIVGGFCRRRTQPEVASELRLMYEVDGQSVVISEERPDWRDPGERMHTPVAKLRFVRSSGLWTLYWMRADLRWHAYELASPSRDLAATAGRFLRRNLVTHPSFELDDNADGMADGWTIFETALGAPVFSASGAAYSGAAAQRITYAGQPGDAASIFARTMTPDGSLAAGDACTASIHVAGAPANSDCNLALHLIAKNAANQSIGSPVSTSVPIPTSSSYARYSVAYSSLPEGTDHVIFYVYVIGIGPSSQIDLRLDGALIERAGSPGSYFDGASASASWDGAPHASTSALYSAEQVSCATTDRDKAGRVIEVELSLQGAAALTSAYQYSANNRLTRQTGAGFDPAASNQVYFYQAMTGWLTRRKMDFENPAGLHGDIDADYTYSESGRLKTAGGVTYTFNGGGALTKVAGSSTTATLTYSKRQKVTAMKENGATVATYQWDNANDRRATEKNASGTVTRRYTYGADGLLAQLEQGTTTFYFTYGADGQRLSMVRDGETSDTTTTYTYDGLSLLSLSGVNGAQKWSVSYLYNASGVPYAGYYEDLGDGGTTPRSAWFAIVTDLRGDVVELLDRSGAPFASYRYSVWGQPQGGSNGVCSRATTAISDADLASDIASRQVLRYCGYAYDAASGLYYCSARYYDPATRQFTSRDPAAADGAESAYQYASGYPTLASDPSGERPIIGPGYYAKYNPKTKRWDAAKYDPPSPWQIAVALYYRMATPNPAATAAVRGGDVKAFSPAKAGKSGFRLGLVGLATPALAGGWGAAAGGASVGGATLFNPAGALLGLAALNAWLVYDQATDDAPEGVARPAPIPTTPGAPRPSPGAPSAAKTPTPSATPDFYDPTKPPGAGCEWRPKGSKPGVDKGNWYNPGTKESFGPDMNHPEGVDPHWDYKVRGNRQEWRWYPDGRLEPK